MPRPTLYLGTAHITGVAPGFADAVSDWVDPRAIRAMVDAVRDGFAAAPVWARLGLVMMLACAVVTGIVRVASSMAGRLVAIVLTAAVVGFVVWGSVSPDFPSLW